MTNYDYSQPYVTRDEYLEVKGIDLSVELQDDDNASNKVNRFIQDITNFVLDHLVMEYNCNELNRQTHNFEDLAEFRRVRFHYGMLEQIEYILNNGLIQLDSGINRETGSITDFSAIVIGQSALKQFRLGGFCNKQEGSGCRGSLDPRQMPTIEELLLLVSRKQDKVDGKGLSTNDFTTAYKLLLNSLSQEINEKVNKVVGKVLSSNDFTNELKAKLQSIEEYAQTNVIEEIDLNNSPIPVSNKKVNIDISGKADKNDVYTKTEVDHIVETMREGLYQGVNTTTYPTVDDFLTSTGEEGIIYLYPLGNEANNYYQYVWETNKGWIPLGTTEIDLNDYYTKEESDTLLGAKADKVGSLPEFEVDFDDDVANFILSNNLNGKTALLNFGEVRYIADFRYNANHKSIIGLINSNGEYAICNDAILPANITFGEFFVTYHGYFETMSNKITSFSSGFTDNQYPSARLVHDQLALKEDVANKVSAFQGTPDDTHYPTEKLVYDNLQNVREVAEGKCKTYILSSATTAPTSDVEAQALKKPDGTAFEDLTDFNIYIGPTTTLANSQFNSQNAAISLNDSYPGIAGWYLIDNTNTVYLSTYIQENFKNGDIFLIIQTDVPDRWLDLSSINVGQTNFYKLETSKVDLTSYYTKTETNGLVSPKADKSMIAPAYDNTATYSVGDKVIYDGKLYTCSTAITQAEDFDATHWTEISVSSGFAGLEDIANLPFQKMTDTVFNALTNEQKANAIYKGLVVIGTANIHNDTVKNPIFFPYSWNGYGTDTTSSTKSGVLFYQLNTGSSSLIQIGNWRVQSNLAYRITINDTQFGMFSLPILKMINGDDIKFFQNNVYPYASNTGTQLKYKTINNISISADTTFTLESAPANTYPEYKANITNSGASDITITLPSGTVIKGNVSISSNTFVIPAGSTVEVNIQNNKALVVEW